MDTKVIRGLDIPRLTLGTVQLGIPYGLKDNAKAPTEEEAGETLDAAVEIGITSFDTASAYGNAEEKIGRWIARNPERKVTIATKVHDLDHSSESALISSLLVNVRESKQRLCVDTIPILMVHHFDEYIENKAAFDRAFTILKDEGDILCSGVSAYSTDDYFQIANSGLNVVQIPVNILDWEQIVSGGLKALKASGMIVFSRSIYLQGLLLRTLDTLPSRMRFALKTVERYIELCDRYCMTQQELAMSFVFSLPEIDSIVVGCRSADQVRGNTKVLNACKTLTERQLDEIRSLFIGTDKRILLPMLWPKE